MTNRPRLLVLRLGLPASVILFAVLLSGAVIYAARSYRSANRYSVVRMNNALIRMDKKTGVLATCLPHSDPDPDIRYAWTCKTPSASPEVAQQEQDAGAQDATDAELRATLHEALKNPELQKEFAELDALEAQEHASEADAGISDSASALRRKISGP